MDITPGDVSGLDARDPLAPMRDRFVLDPALVYLDGNSLGALPRATGNRLARAVHEEWGAGLIRSWNTCDWIGAAERIGGKIAPLIGARPHEVLCADSVSVNLFKLIVAALGARPDRKVVLTEPGNFPTDLYVASGAVDLAPGARIRLAAADAVIEAIDEEVALVVLTHVHYKTGRKLDMRAITAAAHAKGALILWDLSHSTGAVALNLDGDEVDLAVGCGYKYLNGGPGAPAFVYVAERLQNGLRSPLCGWFGHAQPFAFSDDFAPAEGIRRFQCGTPGILGLVALEAGIDEFATVDLEAVLDKSRALSAMFIDLMQHKCAGFDFELVSPADPSQRGSHVSYSHQQAYPICQALIARGVIGDFRAPNVVRFGFTPLYTSYNDVWRAVVILAEVMDSQAWDQDIMRVRAAVT